MTHSSPAPFDRVDVQARLTLLRDRTVNYCSDDVDGPAWKFDHRSVWLAPEQPGAPEPAGSWHTACQLAADYDFCPPEIVRAAFDPTEPLLGRTMLLEGRFTVLRLYVPVRITQVVDEYRAPDRRVWGFSYDTLYGHLEQGRLTYEVIKHEHSGHVEFVLRAVSQRASTLGVVLTLGWAVFGRRRQLRFYERCRQRMHELVRNGRLPNHHADRTRGLTFAPADAQAHWLDRVAVHNVDPG